MMPLDVQLLGRSFAWLDTGIIVSCGRGSKVSIKEQLVLRGIP